MKPVLAALFGALLFMASPARANGVVAYVDIRSQRMNVWVDGARQFSWPVSTARTGYLTPTGSFRPQRLHRSYFSRKYDNAPMPYAVFFHRGWAIHGTNDLRRLGRPASHGCIRLAPAHAGTFYRLIRQYGRADTRIVITR
ncbi:lipoprotein-anchoring transpeptidase ErfK/SrfK [Ancylobacter sp. 3268]|uniref:L,D-transpeptidase n=1 Tax=Ancylobacter sp. 3268 TaxID=2817752 RepID=UPI002855EBF1|nr:L,D-transpeptidase [Ancylobacter sp. 3268]MDR6951860.1 lipoprotein-anchoring transpeptidase ErfK/SrfK [Ancylobacter sp. 3268]